MTINEAIKAAIDNWRNFDGGNPTPVPDYILADQIRELVEEAIAEYLPDANDDGQDEVDRMIAEGERAVDQAFYGER